MITGRRLPIVREQLRRSFRAYAIEVVPLLTGVPLRMNVAIDGMIEVYQAIADRRVTRARVEVGFGLGKSTLAVAYATWRLARRPGHRAIHGSHSHDLAARDSRKARRLVESEWFRVRFPEVRLRDDENTAAQWATTRDGRYVAVGVGGSLTGHRAHEVVVDDAINAVDARSAATLETTYTWLAEGLMSRLDLDPDGGDGTVLVIGQRLSVGDVHGRLAELPGWSVLTLPAEYDSARPCIVLDGKGSELWRDPRTVDGELVAPDTLPAEKLDTLRVAMGSAAYQAQLNQRPVDESASMFPRSAFTRRWTELPKQGRKVITLDASFKESKSSDFAVIQVWQATGGDRYLVEQWRKQAGFVQTLEALRDMARRHPYAKVLVEAAANGHAIVDQLKREVAGVVEVKPDGGKVSRAGSVQGIVESGAVVLPAHAAWVDAWLDEVCAFPNGARNDDQVDAMVIGLRATQVSDDPIARTKATIRARQLLSAGRHFGRRFFESQATKENDR